MRAKRIVPLDDSREQLKFKESGQGQMYIVGFKYNEA